MPESTPSNILLYGKGVFTTIAVRGGECVLWEKHWHRLSAHAKRLEMDLSQYTEDAVRRAVADVLQRDKVADGRVRISLLDESTSTLWGSDPAKKTGLSVITGPSRPIPEVFRVSVSPHRVNSTSPLAGIKSCNYLDPLLSLEEANRRGFHEAIRLNERGEVASACLANVYWLKGGRLYTPSLKTGCLAGTTREFVLENLDCLEVEAELDQLRGAEAIFLSSAGLGVIRAAAFESVMLSAAEHPITSLLPY